MLAVTRAQVIHVGRIEAVGCVGRDQPKSCCNTWQTSRLALKTRATGKKRMQDHSRQGSGSCRRFANMAAFASEIESPNAHADGRK